MTSPVIRPALIRIGRRVALARAGLGFGQWLAPSLGSLLLLCLLDNLLHFPAGVRLVLSLGILGLVVGGFAVRLWRPLSRSSPERTAMLLEEVAGITDNRMINACQFEAQAGAGLLRAHELALVGGTVSGSRGALSALPWARLLHLRALIGWLALMAGVALALGAYAVVFPDHARNALLRLVLPLADHPPLGAVGLTVHPQHDLTLYEGDSLPVSVSLVPLDGARGDHQYAGSTVPVPVLLRGQGGHSVDEDETGLEHIALVSGGPQDQLHFTTVLADLHRTCCFRVLCAGTWSQAITVTVLPRPALVAARFLVDGPDYSGQHQSERPGPPATLTLLPGSTVTLIATLDQTVGALHWKIAGQDIAMSPEGASWKARTAVAAGGAYTLVVPDGDGKSERLVAQGTIQLDSDHPPHVELSAGDRNRFVDPGEHVDCDVLASDDIGLASVTVITHPASDPDGPATTLHAWSYIGPPGNPGPIHEHVRIAIDAQHFHPGASYMIEAVARDYSPPSGQIARSQPIVLRVRSFADMNLPPGDPLSAAFELLKETIASETRARAITGNVGINLPDILAHQSLPHQIEAMAGAQEHAEGVGKRAVQAFRSAKDDASITVLEPIISSAMPDVRAEAKALTVSPALPDRIAQVGARQDDIIARLVTLLGDLAERAKERAKAKAKTGAALSPMDGQREKIAAAAHDLHDDLDRFIKDQQRIIARSKTLADHGPADLTTAEDKVLGELTKEESAWAKFLEEKLTDFSKLPGQDFADGRQAEEGNAVWQDIKAAAKALGQKNVEVAVPGEQGGLELAKKIENNLERWMAESADNTRWSMEEPKTPADVPIAELPKELEDIIGDLIDKEKDMTDDVQDVSSSWMDSIDKGAGWGSGDGPISNMSAKGITGNSLPNHNEVAGRSGEGRNGRSNGQMVEDTAHGKGGEETPTRLSPSPFEQGSVKDTDTKGNGGATGGGKIDGFASEGLRGPTPAPNLHQAMARLAGKQAQLRQQASDLALRLRAEHMPSGDLENAVRAMAALEAAAHDGRGDQIRARYSQALDTLSDAKQAVAAETLQQREHSRLPERLRRQAMAGSNDAVPPGYEDMVGRYFQSLAGNTTDSSTSP